MTTNCYFQSSDEGAHSYFMERILFLSSAMNPTVGAWSHHCTSWSTSSNKRRTYFEGKLVAEQDTPARTLGLGGYLFFNNENHYDGSDRETHEIFGGELYKVNFFTKELTGQEILEMKLSGLCSDVEEKYGSTRYLKWEDILAQDRNGHVIEVSTGCPAKESCPAFSRWDILYEEPFFNQTLTRQHIEQLKSFWDQIGKFSFIEMCFFLCVVFSRGVSSHNLLGSFKLH